MYKLVCIKEDNEGNLTVGQVYCVVFDAGTEYYLSIKEEDLNILKQPIRIIGGEKLIFLEKKCCVTFDEYKKILINKRYEQ